MMQSAAANNLVPAGTLALLVKTFPKLSESFILGEVLALQNAGLPLIVYSLQRPTDALQQPSAAGLRCPIVYLPELPEPQLIDSLVEHWRRAGIVHVHAHFIDLPARLAELATQRLGIRYSISAHAKDIYLGERSALAARLAHAAFTVTCTDYNRRALQDCAPAGARVHLNHHGVDTEHFAPPGSRDASAELRLLAVGRLRPKKGFATALRALAELRDRGLYAGLTIVGYGPEEAALRALGAELGLEQQVHFTGSLSHRELAALYRANDIFLAPSEITADGDRDGIPNVLLEAMASGMATIAANVSGLPEAVEDRVSGLLFRSGDASELAERIALLAGDGALRARLGAAARARVQRHFSLAAAHNRLCDLLAEHLAPVPAVANDAPKSPEPAIGYVVMGYPRRSEAFISNEILQLERLGLGIRVFAIKQGDAGEPHRSVRDIRAPVHYLPKLASLSGTAFLAWLRAGWPAYAPSHARLWRRRPLAYLRVLARSLAMCLRYRKDRWTPRKVFIKEFLQAGAIAEQLLAKPGIRHLHGHFCHGATTITWMAASLAGLPYSFTAHAKDLWQRDQNPGDLLDRKIQGADFVVTCTEANREELHRADCRHATVATVYHGLDTQFFQRDAHSATGAAPLILAVGRLVEKKGFRYLLDACAQLRDADLDFRCLIVGEDGPERAVLEQRVAALGLEAHIEFRPPVDHHGLRTLYQQAALFVLPCLVAEDGDRDGIPNVLAEAMAMELPVISTAVSGIPEIVVDDENGRLVPERNAEALARAMAVLLRDPAAAAKLGRAARATIQQKFDAARTHVLLKNLFEQSLVRRAAGEAATARIEQIGTPSAAIEEAAA